MKKLKGFTMIELIVSLIISGILISICLRVYTNFNQYINRTLTNQDNENKIVWFALRLKEDIFKADYISGDSETLNIYINGRKNTYNFLSNYVLINRNDTQTDSIGIIIKDIKVDYYKKGFINYIEFDYENGGNFYTFSSNKKYLPGFLFDKLN